MSQSHRYFYDIELSESNGHHRVFLLPQTGEYRLVFGVSANKLPVPLPNSESPIPSPAYDVERTLRVRAEKYTAAIASGITKLVGHLSWSWP